VSGRILRADSIALAAFGVLLLLAPWDGLYGALGLPETSPELWAQLAGTLLLAFSYLLWIAPRNARLTQAVAFAAAIANLGGAVVVFAWLGRGIETDAFGTPLLVLIGVAGAVFGAAEAWIASRSVAMLVPGD
jgi:hypothetical protein